MKAEADVKPEIQVFATIIRADGSREELGQIVGQYNGRLDRLRWRLIGQPLANARTRRSNKIAAQKAG